MSLMKCPECGHEVSNKATTCPNCGNPIKKSSPKNNNSGCLILLAIFILLVIFGNIGSKKDKPKYVESNDRVVKNEKKLLCNSYNSAWDGSVYKVEKYLKSHLKDPSSFDSIEWSPIVKGNDGQCIVRCKYRAKNSFGGYSIENTLFKIDQNGDVISAIPLGK